MENAMVEFVRVVKVKEKVVARHDPRVQDVATHTINNSDFKLCSPPV